MNKIIGVRYIGPKESQEDVLLNTGAVWTPGQVHNFAAPLAQRLLEHTDSWEEAPVSLDGDTFMGSHTPHRRDVAPVAYINLTGMDAESLALFAKRELNRTIDIDGRDIDAIRADVHRLMITSNMDEIANEVLDAQPEGIPYAIMVSAAEYEALMCGQIVAKLVPAEVAGMAHPVVLSSNQDGPAREDAADHSPTLDELLDSLDKDGLLEFAAQEGVEGLNGRNSPDTMRRTIKEAIEARGDKPA